MRVKISGKVCHVDRFTNVNYHRPTTGMPEERIARDADGNPMGVLEFVRTVIIVDSEGQGWQWFGKPSTSFWQAFSSKSDAPIGLGDSVTIEATVKMVDSEAKTYPAGNFSGYDLPARTVIQRPKLV